jgi:hypothetical protein
MVDYSGCRSRNTRRDATPPLPPISFWVFGAPPEVLPWRTDPLSLKWLTKPDCYTPPLQRDCWLPCCRQGILSRYWSGLGGKDSAQLGFDNAIYIQRRQIRNHCSGRDHGTLLVCHFAAFAVSHEQAHEKLGALPRPQGPLELRPYSSEKFLNFLFCRFGNWLNDAIQVRVQRPQVTSGQTISGCARDASLPQKARPLAASTWLRE